MPNDEARNPKFGLPANFSVVLGGGGHTFELIEVLGSYPGKIAHLNVILEDSDSSSLPVLKANGITSKSLRVYRVPRPTFVLCKYSCMQLLFSAWGALKVTLSMERRRGEVLLCNGPGLCVPLAAFYRLFSRGPVVYIESITRQITLSFTGKILQFLANVFIVQSKKLERKAWPARTYIELFQFAKSAAR